MNEAEVFKAARLLFEAAVFFEVSSFEPDPREFGKACDDEVARGSTHARAFFVANRVDGRHACDFRQMISMAYSAGMMHWRGGGDPKVYVQVSPRYARDGLVDDVSESELIEARALARNYFERVGALARAPVPARASSP